MILVNIETNLGLASTNEIYIQFLIYIHSKNIILNNCNYYVQLFKPDRSDQFAQLVIFSQPPRKLFAVFSSLY